MTIQWPGGRRTYMKNLQKTWIIGSGPTVKYFNKDIFPSYHREAIVEVFIKYKTLTLLSSSGEDA